jgi:trimeric autotransporter adhesin
MLKNRFVFFALVLFMTLTGASSLMARPPRTLFVNNTNPMSGDGSLGNPYNTLAGAQAASIAGDVIFVFAGDGTSLGMNTGFILKDNQSLIGSGLPLITNPSGNGIELANNNEVSGLHIDSTGAWAIHGAGINKTLLSNNIITNPLTQGGIGLFSCIHSLKITNSTIQNGDVNSFGIYIENRLGTISSVDVTANVISNFLEDIAIFAFDTSSITSTVSFNDTSQTSSVGIDVDAFDQGSSKTTIQNNTVHNNTFNGIITFTGTTSESVPSSAFLQSTIKDNIITNNLQEGLVVATGNRGKQAAFVTGNTLSGNGGVAGMLAETSLTSTPGDVICLRLKNNTSTTGFSLINFAGDTFNLEPATGNVGTITTTGTITPVASGFCN